ncbi:MAG: hypothetical protein HYW06_05470 [Gemmatimonadetes bacterium]|nr:hypothetical protein [Gemmatimonadota bacterium]
MQEPSALGRAVLLVRDLRKRCPWDGAQTPETLRPYLVEEVLELDHALGQGDPGAIRDELGDLLLHLAFQIVLDVAAAPAPLPRPTDHAGRRGRRGGRGRRGRGGWRGSRPPRLPWQLGAHQGRGARGGRTRRTGWTATQSPRSHHGVPAPGTGGGRGVRLARRVGPGGESARRVGRAGEGDSTGARGGSWARRTRAGRSLVCRRQSGSEARLRSAGGAGEGQPAIRRTVSRDGAPGSTTRDSDRLCRPGPTGPALGGIKSPRAWLNHLPRLPPLPLLQPR